MLTHKLGRLPRTFTPGIMHLSSILGARTIVPPPAKADWAWGLTDFGMMLNDRLGDCTCAAAYHARQIWTANSKGVEDTQPDAEVLGLYEKACGYDPDDSSTDRGGNEQNVLTYLLNEGYPMKAGADPEKITAFFEVDPRAIDDVKTVINECGVCYIGFNVPDNIDETPGATWQLDKGASIEGGHAVVLVGYDADSVTLISWGKLYKMTWDFFTYYTDEAYAIISPDWTRDGKTPLGLTDDELQMMMDAVKQ